MTPIVTLRSLIEWDDTLFDEARLPDGADPDTLISWILREYGEMQVTIPDWSALRFYSDNWFNAQYRSISRLWTAYMADYNALWNKDGTVEETRTPDLTDKRVPDLTTELTHGKKMTESGSRTSQLEGFQSSSFSDVAKELPAGVITNSGKDSTTEKGSDTVTHTGTETVERREFGNIGLTTSQSMLSAEVSLWSNFNWYSVVAAMWAKDFCVMIY